MDEKRVLVFQTALRGSPEVFELPHPTGQWVPSGTNLGHQLQVTDSKELKSANHSVNRTGGRSPSVSRADSLVHVPQALKTVARHFATRTLTTFRYR